MPILTDMGTIPTDSFQEPVEPNLIIAMCRHVFGDDVNVKLITKLTHGMYNNTFKIELGGLASLSSVILKVAPSPRLQTHTENQFMRNEHLAIPYFDAISLAIPRVLFTDFTHELIDRDYMFLSVLEGIPAVDGLYAYERHEWSPFYEQIGHISRRIHETQGVKFGPILGPGFGSWSEAFLASLNDVIVDLEGLGLDAADAHELMTLAERSTDLFDAVKEPRLLHGDLWTVNLMIDPTASVPTISGVFDFERASWGDPYSDWAVLMALRKPGTERDSFWEGLGSRPTSASELKRQQFYIARNAVTSRLEFLRTGQLDKLAGTYSTLSVIVPQL